MCLETILVFIVFCFCIDVPVNVEVCVALNYRCSAALLWLVVLVLDYRQLISLTHPLLQFDVGGQELHEEFMLEWVQVFCKVVCNVIRRFNIL